MKGLAILAATLLLLAVMSIGSGMVLAQADLDPHAPLDTVARHGMVAAAHPLAAQAGVDVMRAGGNAIDAAIATALTLNVVEPNASGLGGGGFMVIRFAKTGDVAVIDYREKAPASATRDMYASDQAKKELWTQLGGKAIGVPGTLKGLEMALQMYGTLAFADVAAPAIKLAEEGFEVSSELSGIIKDNYEKLARYNDPDKVPYLCDGLPLEPGDILRNPELAATFRLIAEKGSDALYRGPVGEAIVAAVNKSGGNMTMQDLADYNAVMRTPVRGTYRGLEIISMPPPSSGGTHLIEILNVMENYDVKALGHNTPAYMHTLAEVLKLVFADRAAYMADADFVKVPVTGLTSKEYAKTLFNQISPDKVLRELKPGEPENFEHESTTHLTVIDEEGNIVSLTQTINYFFASGVMAEGTGLLLNNEMDDFSTNPNSVSAPEPGKRPLSSMSPTIILKDGKPFMALGTPGATRIFPSMAQIIMNVVDFGMGLDEAIEAPRMFCSSSAGKPGTLFVESRIPAEVRDALKAMGHNVSVRGDYDSYFGGTQAILLDQSSGMIHGAADSRRLGAAIGF
ncbi:MAG: Gamma-glutamyltranspeptidase precursor [Firmicutes bacterium ADurb.BinA052]|nr:MAG: Gamma-glutamyltranspeptidase precursor [Firmicutes bacterium ADurb.BinA052]